MKYLRLILFLLAGMLAGSMVVVGQDGQPPGDGPRDEHPDERRPNLLAELGLSREQIHQIRLVNQERRPMMIEAQRRMRVANRELDSAIYRDAVSDDEFQVRLKEVQAAQADLARLRFESELSVRKILTPDQLVRFRELRRKFAEARENDLRNHRMRPDGGQNLPPMGDRPLRRRPVDE